MAIVRGRRVSLLKFPSRAESFRDFALPGVRGNARLDGLDFFISVH